MEAIGAAATDPIGALLEHDGWRSALQRAAKARVPRRWRLIARSWQLLTPHVVINRPTTHEEVLSEPIYGGTLGLTRLRGGALDAANASRIGDLWDTTSRTWRRSLTRNDRRRVYDAIPTPWLHILRDGPTAIDTSDWILTDTPLAPLRGVQHAATGMPHATFGVLYLVGAHVGLRHARRWLREMAPILRLWVNRDTVAARPSVRGDRYMKQWIQHAARCRLPLTPAADQGSKVG